MALLILLLLFSLAHADLCKPPGKWYEDRERGWFFGEWCEKVKEKKEERKERRKVVRVPWDRIDRMDWREIRKLIEEVKGQAVMNPTYENVREWKRLQLWMTKKSMDFMRMDMLVTVTSGDVYVVNRGSPYYNRERIRYINSRVDEILMKYRGKAGLVVFVDPVCQYCRLYEPIVRDFRRETGWDVMFVNVRKMPEVAMRLGVSVVPDTFVVLRKGGEYLWQRAGTGAFTLNVLKRNVVMALWALREVSYEEVFGEPQSGSVFGQ